MTSMYLRLQPFIPLFFAWCVLSTFIALILARLTHGYAERRERSMRRARRCRLIERAHRRRGWDCLRRGEPNRATYHYGQAAYYAARAKAHGAERVTARGKGSPE